MDEIDAPPGAPAELCLLGVPDWDQGLTRVYLCNAGPLPLLDLTDASDCIFMRTWYCATPEDRWAESFLQDTMRWPVLPPGRGVLIDTPSHQLWDIVCRHRLAYATPDGRCWTAEVLDLDLNASRLGQEPGAIWVPVIPQPT